MEERSKHSSSKGCNTERESAGVQWGFCSFYLVKGREGFEQAIYPCAARLLPFIFFPYGFF